MIPYRLALKLKILKPGGLSLSTGIVLDEDQIIDLTSPKIDQRIVEAEAELAEAVKSGNATMLRPEVIDNQ